MLHALLSTRFGSPTSTLLRLFGVALSMLLLAGVAGAQSDTAGSTPAGLAPGAPAGSYALSGFDNVNLFNGNLNFRLPLLKVGGRGGAGYQMTLPVDQTWSVHGQENEITHVKTNHPHADWWTPNKPGYGPGTLYGRQDGDGSVYCGEFTLNRYESTLTRLTFTGADGTEYELHDRLTGGEPKPLPSPCAAAGFNRGRTFVTADGSSATFVSDADVVDYAVADEGIVYAASGYLMLRDGTRYRVVGGLVRWLRDRNGNLLTFDYTNGRVTTITDSLGRQVTVAYDVQEGGDYGLCDKITYIGFGGAPRVIRISKVSLGGALHAGYSLKTFKNLFPALDGSSYSNYNPAVVGSVWLPDGVRRYRLFYNSHGELARVELPTGGATEYVYANGFAGGSENGEFRIGPQWHIHRRVVERRVYADGANLESRMTYSRPESMTGVVGYGGSVGYVEVDQLDPAGALKARQRHHFHGTVHSSFYTRPTEYAKWRQGREHRTESYDIVNGSPVLKSVVEQTWQQPAAGATWPLTLAETSEDAKPNDPQMTEVKSTLSDSGQVSKQTFAYDRYSNQTDVREYDFGAGAAPPHPVRHTHTDYLTTNVVGGTTYDYACDPSSTCSSLSINPSVIHQRGLAKDQFIYAVDPSTGAETLAARSHIDYDQTGLTDRSAITGLCTFYTGSSCDSANSATYRTRGNPTSVTRYADAAGGTGALTATTDYDIAGNVVSTTDPKGNTSQVSYSDSFCNGTTCGGSFTPNTYAFPTGTTSPVPDPTNTYGTNTALVTSNVYDFWTGHVSSITDANNKTTSAEYDPQDELDRLKAVVRPDGGRTDYEYGDTVGNLYARTLSDLDASRRTQTKRYFDGLGRPYRSQTYENQDAGAAWLTVDTEYDALGRVKKVSSPYRSQEGTANLFSTDKWTEMTYDALGRVLTVKTMPHAATVTTSYSGNIVTVADQAGKQRRSAKDALGRLTQVVEAPDVSPCQTDGRGCPTDYTYDALGNLRKVDQGGQFRFFMYDSLSRMLRAKNPEQAANTALVLTDTVTGNAQWSLAYAYDANGNLLTKTDARGVTANYAYDGLNRNTLVQYADSVLGPSNHTPTVERHYDGAPNGRGRLWWHQAVGVVGTAVDSYDAMGRPTQYHQVYWAGNDWGENFNVSLSYDKAGKVTSRTYPSGRVVTYNYDAAGRPGDHNGQAAMAGNLGDGVQRTYASEVRYHELGGMEQERFGTDTPVYNKSLYNSRGQLAEIRVSTHSILAPGQETNWNRGAIINHYSSSGWGASGGGADNNGNLRKQEVYIPHDDQLSGYLNVVQYYGYDALNRLASVEDKPFNGAPDFYQAYTYDRWGNRTVNGGATWNAPEPQFGVDAATNRLSPPAGYTMTYDAAGNLVHDNYTGAGTRSYDAENRMISAQDFYGQTSTYTYDADGRRVRRSATGSTPVWQVYGLGGELLAEYAANSSPSQPQKEYGYRGGELLVSAEASTAPPPPAAGNSGFEAPAVGGGAFQYGPTGGSWAFVGGAGVSGNNSAFTSGNPPAPEGAQVAFVQGGSGSYLSQTVSGFQAGASYTVTFKAARRGNGGGAQDFDVYLDQTLLGTFAPAGTSYAQLSTAAFTATAGAHTLKFVGRNTAGGDNTAFLDDVRVTAASGPQSFVTNKTLGALRNDYTGHVGMKITVGAQPLTINSLGRIHVSGNTGTHTLKVVRASDNAVVATANLSMSGGTPGQFKYAALASPVTLSANTDYYVVSMETAGGDTWHDYAGTVLTTTSAAAVSSGAFSGNGVSWIPAGGAGNCYVPVDFQYGAGGGATGGSVKWLVSDHLGTPRMVIDQTGSLSGVRRHDYLPFGEELAAGVGGRTTAQGYSGTDNIRQKFTGKERDGETGLDFFEARYYASIQGRFTSPDPLLGSGKVADPQSWNRYAYVGNNPLAYVDPSGMLAIPSDDEQKRQQQQPPIDSQEVITVNATGPRIVDFKVTLLDTVPGTGKEAPFAEVPVGGKFQVSYTYTTAVPNDDSKPEDHGFLAPIKEGSEGTLGQGTSGAALVSSNVDKIDRDNNNVTVTKTDVFEAKKPENSSSRGGTFQINYRIVARNPNTGEMVSTSSTGKRHPEQRQREGAPPSYPKDSPPPISVRIGRRQ